MSKKATVDSPFYKKIPAWLYAMTAVLFGWVLFRAENLPLVLSYFKVLFGSGVTGDSTALLFLAQKTVYYLAAIMFSAPLLPYLRRVLNTLRENKTTAVIPVICDILYPILMLSLFLICTAYLLKSTYNPFIYFNF